MNQAAAWSALAEMLKRFHALRQAFRAFQIPEQLRERYGYPELTSKVKEKILGLNAARVYGIDVEQARANARIGDLAWAREALAEYNAKGVA